MGGTERVTDILSSELQKGNKHQCFWLISKTFLHL